VSELNEAQINALCAADAGDLYRAALGTYRIAGYSTPIAVGYGLYEAGLIKSTCELVTHYNDRGRAVTGETMRLTAAGREALNSLGIPTNTAA
jgi:hypothetical protein